MGNVKVMDNIKVMDQEQTTPPAFQLMLSILLIMGVLLASLNVAHAAGADTALEKRAHDGNPQAQFQLGNVYLNAQGSLRDVNKALQWLTYAANNHFPQAQQTLALLYFHGWHVPENALTAKYWFERAVQNGVAEAGYYLQKPEFSAFTTISGASGAAALHIGIYGKVKPAR
ncbi:MAG: hypothetical protein COB59_09010 [Rhodospirillaceae bacterium]|nr:MAG: hypothetical protein COB59_09010 [Rhodospirillaceae bacterium]